MAQEIIELLAPQYPQIQFSTPDNPHTITPYATYRVGLYFGGDTTNQPIDFRRVGFHRSAGYILGVDPGNHQSDLIFQLPEALMSLMYVSRHNPLVRRNTGTMALAGVRL